MAKAFTYWRLPEVMARDLAGKKQPEAKIKR